MNMHQPSRMPGVSAGHAVQICAPPSKQNSLIMRFVAVAMIMILAAACTHTANQREKTVSYGNGLIVFQLPDDWVSETEVGGNGIYFNQAIGSNALRLSVISFKFNPGSRKFDPRELLARNRKRENISRLTNGNLIQIHDDESVEDGVPIATRFWTIYQVVNGNCGRIFVFSYTAPTASMNNQATSTDLAFLDKSIKNSIASTSDCHQ